jgi:hypothetical protein
MPVICRGDIFANLIVFVSSNSQRVKGVDIGGESVDHGFVFSFEGAKEAIPNYQDASVVSV